MTVGFLASLLKKGWNNISSLHIKTSMGKPVKIYGWFNFFSTLSIIKLITDKWKLVNIFNSIEKDHIEISQNIRVFLQHQLAKVIINHLYFLKGINLLIIIWQLQKKESYQLKKE